MYYDKKIITAICVAIAIIVTCVLLMISENFHAIKYKNEPVVERDV